MSRVRLTKITAPSAPPTTTAEIFYSLADSKLEAIDENGKLAVLGGFASSDFRLIRVFMITASGTYALTGGTIQMTPGTRALYVEALGGGGGGGGAPATSSNVSCAGGGGGGGYSASFIASAAASYAVTIGAGGAGGVAGATTGSTGTATNFGSGLIIANGGAGGGPGTSPGTAAAIASAGAGGAAGTGDLTVSGQVGAVGVVMGATVVMGYNGGGTPPFSPAGMFGASVVASGQFAPPAAALYGHGGYGAFNIGTQSAAKGGDGSAGIIRVWEFA